MPLYLAFLLLSLLGQLLAALLRRLRPARIGHVLPN
jgi:hypothetical protein